MKTAIACFASVCIAIGLATLAAAESLPAGPTEESEPCKTNT